ncbi:hypothetical protein G6F70_005207 [Rhizopus microsporus]|nr:hypothetical protein G6F71_002976 [Rhizopus microsporus]KAG1199128.1 hypothetical protein G6F70_005207 [Rhizopus microsporus]KAG1210955.1 hypothetical protein G6F69_005026 [Rhizopus microsporus]KAG1232794.1 hypothetical protein G6F67_004759 [Rhizopus microsporus]KAG1259123.1 hypothetical protein G6F68_008323 [Rhizopus microsporus]
MPTININDNLTTCIIPDMMTKLPPLFFWTNEKAKPFLGHLLAASLRLRTIKYQCAHAGKPKKRKESEVPTKKARTKESIKIACPAYINKHILTDGAVEVKYRWKHPDYNPYDMKEIISYRLPSKVKQWIEEHVNQNMGWKSIKYLLRMDEARLLQHLQEAEEWSIDSTHIPCKPFNDPKNDGYLFTVVIRSSTTNKGLSVCFFVTDHEIISTLH